MEKKLKIAIAAVFAALFGACIALVKLVDVQPIGPAGTEVGMATVNRAVFNLLQQLVGSGELFDKISDLAILAAFAVGASFGLVGLIQLIRRKSLFKIDREIWGLGVAYLLAGIVYLAFELYVVNYRPILEDGAAFPEASFPSSHTVLAFVVFATAFIAWGRLLEKRAALARLLQTAAILALIVAVAARLLAGVHWVTDIAAGCMVSLAITFFYSALVTE